jgi:arylsulfatase A-like enzyme
VTIRSVLRAAILLVLSALLPACERNAHRPPNVLLVVIDTLRADKLGAYGNTQGLTPFLDDLATRGAVFERTYAVASWTIPSMASLFTSRYPTQHRVVTFGQRIADDEVTIGDRLGNAGWVGGGFAANPNLQKQYGYAQGFAAWQAAGADVGEVDGDVLRAQALAWLDAAWRPERGAPGLLYVHYMEPHAPYEPREPFRSRFAIGDDGRVLDTLGAVRQALARASGGALRDAPDAPLDIPTAFAYVFGRGTPLTREYAAPLERLYDAEVASVDDQVRQLFDELERRRFLEHAIVVVTADHGEKFYEHGRGSHGDTLYEADVRVPLIVVGPGVPPGLRVTDDVSLIDVAPTLLDLLGLDREPRFEGRSLVPLLAGGAPRAPRPDVILQLERTVPENLDMRIHVRGLVRDRHKIVVGRDGGEELFDLATDPGETRSDPPTLAAEKSVLTGALARAEAQLGERAVAAASPAPVDEKLKERLRALGYTP